MKAAEVMTEETRVTLLAKLLMSQPWTLVACGLGEIKGEHLAKHLLSLRTASQSPTEGKT